MGLQLRLLGGLAGGGDVAAKTPPNLDPPLYGLPVAEQKKRKVRNLIFKIFCLCSVK